MKQEYRFDFETFRDSAELAPEDAALLAEARKTTQNAYAPYSNFLVGAAGLLANGEKVFGTNQENASYPVGICAERVLLSNAAMQQKDQPIKTIAISYDNHSKQGGSDKPVSPCGLCRQSLAEYEQRTGSPIRLILAGMQGEVIVIKSASQLLPLSFGGEDLK